MVSRAARPLSAEVSVLGARLATLKNVLDVVVGSLELGVGPGNLPCPFRDVTCDTAGRVGIVVKGSRR